MRYINDKTGVVIESPCKISGGNWREVTPSTKKSGRKSKKDESAGQTPKDETAGKSVEDNEEEEQAVMDDGNDEDDQLCNDTGCDQPVEGADA